VDYWTLRETGASFYLGHLRGESYIRLFTPPAPKGEPAALKVRMSGYTCHYNLSLRYSPR